MSWRDSRSGRWEASDWWLRQILHSAAAAAAGGIAIGEMLGGQWTVDSGPGRPHVVVNQSRYLPPRVLCTTPRRVGVVKTHSFSSSCRSIDQLINSLALLYRRRRIDMPAGRHIDLFVYHSNAGLHAGRRRPNETAVCVSSTVRAWRLISSTTVIAYVYRTSRELSWLYCVWISRTVRWLLLITCPHQTSLNLSHPAIVL